MLWTSILSYFADSSRLAAIYTVITLLILSDSFKGAVTDMRDFARSKFFRS